MTPPGSDAVALRVASDGSATDAVLALAEHLTLSAPVTTRVDRTFVDSFDGRLRAKGLVAERATTRGTSSTLTVHGPGSAPHTAAVAATGRLLVTDLPEGSLRELLAAVLDVRALLPLARVRSQIVTHGVLNDDRKTVARVVVETPVAMVPGRRPTTLPVRVRVEPVLGYRRAFTRVVRLLRADPGLVDDDHLLADEAAAAAGTAPPVDVDPGAGLTPDLPAAEAGLIVCRRLADVVEHNLPGTIDDLDPEFLHDLRVAVRRSRSVLRELRDVLPEDGLATARESLRWVQQATNATRDLDVHLIEWHADERLDPLLHLLRERRAGAFTAMRKALRSARFRRTWESWRGYLDHAADADGPAIAPEAARRIRGLYRRMSKDGAAIDDATPPEALHELRKRGKELRYLLEHFGGLWPDEAVKPLVSSLKKLQDVLGRHQDRHVQAAQLRDLAPDLAAARGGPEALLALGPLVERLEDEQAAARKRFQRRFAAFTDDDVRASVKATFR